MIAIRIVKKIRHYARFLLTTVMLTLWKPSDNITIATLNSFEENASALIAELDIKEYSRIYVLAPEPEIILKNLRLTQKVLDAKIDFEKIEIKKLNYYHLLTSFLRSKQTYVTHVLIPGQDFSAKRRHTLLTHGSGIKREIAFKSPVDILYSVVDYYVEYQKIEYKLKPNVSIVKHQPRINIFHNSSNHSLVKKKLGIEPSKKFALWVPTYRTAVKDKKNEKVAGEKLNNDVYSNEFNTVASELRSAGYEVLMKIHSVDMDSYLLYDAQPITNKDLQKLELLFYEVLAATDLVITDYSSIYDECIHLGKKVVTWKPDIYEYSLSYRGFRDAKYLSPGIEEAEYRNTFLKSLQATNSEKS